MSKASEHVFPAIRGRQAGQEIYVSLCPLQLAVKMFQFADESVPEPLRNNRHLNLERVAQLAKYLVANPTDYVLAPLFVSIGGVAHFDAFEPEADLGLLRIPMSARLILNGGEHERAAVEKAIIQKPALSNEKIPVIFQPDRRLRRAGNIYLDLQAFSVRPSASLRLLNARNDDSARLTRELIGRATPFRGFVEMKRSTLAPRSKMMFTFSSIYHATKSLLAGHLAQTYEMRLNLASKFWDAVDAQLPEWQMARSGKISPGELRARFLHTHALALQAIGKVGNTLLKLHTHEWEARLKMLRKIDWRRENAKDWEGRAFVGGKVSKATSNVVLTGNVIRKALGLRLTESENAVEQAMRAGRSMR